MSQSEWITSGEAQLRLNVRAQTLYAYVSRGRVQVRSDPADPRRSLYRAADIDDLAGQSRRSRKRADIASGAIAWGEPVLSSGITTVRAGRFYYRAQDAVLLAEDRSLEEVAALLLGRDCAPPDRRSSDSSGHGVELNRRLYHALAEKAATSPPLQGSTETSINADARELLDVMADAAAGVSSTGQIHQRLAAAWGADPGGPAGDFIRRTLVLVADHELNASTFAARVTASTGASLASAVLSGLSALSGPRHGGMGAMVSRFALEAELHGARDAVRGRLLEGRHLPGFGHPLYPLGDIRAKALLDRFALSPLLAELCSVAKELADAEPNVDFAIIAICKTLGLPIDAPFAIFATGRSAGWIAHAVEQNELGKLIRPRAKYVGPQPEDGFTLNAAS